MTDDETVERGLRVPPVCGGVERERVRGNLLARMFTRRVAPLKVGRYRIGPRIGGGGQGDVYRARDPLLDRDVALKVLHHGTLASRREAQALAQLSHPNIVAVFATGRTKEGETGSAGYLVTELIDGVPLSRWIENIPPVRRRLEVLLDCARGLAAAHRAGLVHADFKPSNVLIDQRGDARVIDFGIAASGTQTRSGDGTPGYVAPERMRGELGPAADQYAWCIVADELLKGVPVSGRLRRALTKGRNDDPRRRFASLVPLIVRLEAELKPRRTLFAGLVVAVGLAGTGLAAEQERPTPECTNTDTDSRWVWSAKRRDVLRVHDDRVAAVELIDAWVERWDLRRLEVCRAQNQAQIRCLHERLEDLDALIEQLTDDDGASTATVELARLEPPRCERTPSEPRDSRAEADAIDAMRDAKVAMSEKDVDGAIATLEGVLADHERLSEKTAAMAMIQRGDADLKLGARDTAEDWYEDALWRAVAGDVAFVEARAASKLALVKIRDGDPNEVDTWLVRAHEAAIRADAPEVRRIVFQAEARVNMARGDFDEVVRIGNLLLESAHGGAERSDAINFICPAYQSTGHSAKAIEWCSKGVDEAKSVFGEHHVRTYLCMQSLAAALEGAARFDEANDVLIRAVRGLRELDVPQLVLALNSQGIVREQMDDLEGAARAYEEALAMVDADASSSPRLRDALHINLGSLAIRQDDPELAERYFQRTLIAVDGKKKKNAPTIVHSRWGLGHALLAQGRHREAEKELRIALEGARDKKLGVTTIGKIGVMLAETLFEGEIDPDEATELAREAIRVFTAEGLEEHDTVIEAREMLVNIAAYKNAEP